MTVLCRPGSLTKACQVGLGLMQKLALLNQSESTTGAGAAGVGARSPVERAVNRRGARRVGAGGVPEAAGARGRGRSAHLVRQGARLQHGSGRGRLVACADCRLMGPGGLFPLPRGGCATRQADVQLLAEAHFASHFVAQLGSSFPVFQRPRDPKIESFRGSMTLSINGTHTHVVPKVVESQRSADADPAGL